MVGNPPYITCKDAELRELYRANWPNSAAGKYALAAPFMEMFFDIAVEDGYVGLINANSFMKREFGKKLIEKVLPHLHVQRIIDTSGAYIPGHGTPTVLLFGQRPPLLWGKGSAGKLRVVQGRRGEPETPADPEQGRVWSSIRDHYDEPGYEDDYITVVDAEREKFEKHPWSLGGGGATELKELLEGEDRATLGSLVDSIGFMAITGEDDAFVMDGATAKRLDLVAKEYCTGDAIRDWTNACYQVVVTPYVDSWQPTPVPQLLRALWPLRTVLSNRLMFGKTQLEADLAWYEFRHLATSKLTTPMVLAYGEISTHNHFVLDRGGKVFKQTAPIIKLPPEATEEDHLALLAYLNSSTACFWMKQVFQPKHSAEHKTHPEPERNRFAMSGTGMSKLPVPTYRPENRALLTRYSARLLELGAARTALLSPSQIDAAAALAIG